MARRSRPTSEPSRSAIAGDPAGRHRGIRHHRDPGRFARSRRALPPRRQLGHRPGDPGRPRGGRAADPSPHERRPDPDRSRLPLLRRDAGRRRGAAGRRAADDPPPVRPGPVRQRALVPPGGHDAGQCHRLGRVSPRRPSRPRPESAGSTSSRSRIASRASSSSFARARSSRASSGSTFSVDQDELARVANRLNAELADQTAAEIESRLPAYAAAADRAGATLGRPTPARPSSSAASPSGSPGSLRESDAASVEEVYSDGLLNVMDAARVRPEREAPAGLLGPREPVLPR